MSLEPRPVGVEPRPADGPAFVLCFQHVSINIIFLSPFAAFPLPHSEQFYLNLGWQATTRGQQLVSTLQWQLVPAMPACS